MLTTPLTWLLLAAALAFAGGTAGQDRGRHGRDVRGGRHERVQPAARPRARPSRRALSVVAGTAAGIASLAVAGPATGLVVAAVLGPSAAAITSKLVDRPAVTRPHASLALALDLAAAALRSGQSVPAALTLTAPVLPEALAAPWRRTAALLALGGGPVQAWSVLGADAALAPVATAARRSADSGARLARTFTQLAADTRAAVRAHALARASRAGVFAMAPLGLCFLPAFICLGIVPTIAGIADGIFVALP
jgi:Flp pilus assembly protein TadB